MNKTVKELFSKADAYKSRIDKVRPLSEKEAKNLAEYFRVGLTYSSNAIEGNTLTITETKVLLEDGLTVGGKPIRDYYEATGHAQAYDYMLSLANAEQFNITEKMIRKLHELFYHLIDQNEAGQYRHERVFITGTEYVPPAPEEVPEAMERFVSEINRMSMLHPIEWAALAHMGIVDIHPFVDGNGRTARLIMNMILIHTGYGPAIIPPVRRGDYIDVLRVAQRENNPDTAPFISLIAECVIETQKDYCRMMGIPIRVSNKEKKSKQPER